MQDIAEWLKNGTYEQGVALYERHGSNSFLKKRFAAGADAYNSAKLREELEKLLPAIGTNEVSPAKAPTPAPSTAPKQTSEAATRRYHKLLKERKDLYAQLNMLMAQRYHLPDGEELRICAVGILTTNQKITDIWSLTDYYNANGSFPDEEVPKPPIDPKKEKQLLRQTISKCKSRLKSPTCRNRAQTEKLQQESEARLAELTGKKGVEA